MRIQGKGRSGLLNSRILIKVIWIYNSSVMYNGSIDGFVVKKQRIFVIFFRFGIHNVWK